MTSYNIFDYLEYDENLEGGFYWKIYPSNKAKNRKVAGYLNSDGYWTIEFEGKKYYNHRLILQYLGYEIDDLQVDHIDGNRKNNKPTNLRIVKPSINSKNSRKRSDNTSGITGVWFNQKEQRWCCRWVVNGVKHTRSFSINKYGDSAKILAISKRMENLDNDYTERHGN